MLRQFLLFQRHDFTGVDHEIIHVHEIHCSKVSMYIHVRYGPLVAILKRVNVSETWSLYHFQYRHHHSCQLIHEALTSYSTRFENCEFKPVAY